MFSLALNDGRHDGEEAMSSSNQRRGWDGFEFRCDHDEPVPARFAFDCCNREAISSPATTAGHSSHIVRQVTFAAVENRFGNAPRVGHQKLNG
ncbi:hypothetical protein [Burkholderia sp. WSM2232]|uniref:hypothetical protein n=1 Tax=Burkholderia sp. WSM2232 TaxID=944436 RepID=UPI00047F65C5|nr:hypothetical protein [Burkholderia sp. WSM2232]